MEYIYLLVWLILVQAKHLLVDFYFQPKYMWMNKGDLKHPGGYIHAGLHSFGTMVLFVPFGWKTVLACGLIDFVSHYAIDYWKVNSTKKLGLTPYDPKFWYYVGDDQFLHQVTYIFMIVLAASWV